MVEYASAQKGEMFERIINSEEAAEFANTIRGQYIISQALTIASGYLLELENRDDPYPHIGNHAEPSNRADMDYLLEAFPLYKIHDQEWNKPKEDKE